MKTISLRSTAGLLSFMIASCTDPTRVELNSPVLTKSASATKLEDRVFDDVNKYRSSIGKSTVKRHTGLELLAQKHAEFLASNSNADAYKGRLEYHYGFEIRSDIARTSYGIPTIGENIAKSTEADSKRFVSLWKDSADHRWTLNSEWTYSGVGVALSPNGSVFVTQIFGSSEEIASFRGR